MDGDGRSVSFAQTSAPGIVNTFNFESVSTDVYARGTVGLSARIFARGTIDAGITTTFGKDQGAETSGHVGLKVGI